MPLIAFLLGFLLGILLVVLCPQIPMGLYGMSNRRGHPDRVGSLRFENAARRLIWRARQPGM